MLGHLCEIKALADCWRAGVRIEVDRLHVPVEICELAVIRRDPVRVLLFKTDEVIHPLQVRHGDPAGGFPAIHPVGCQRPVVFIDEINPQRFTVFKLRADKTAIRRVPESDEALPAVGVGAPVFILALVLMPVIKAVVVRFPHDVRVSRRSQGQQHGQGQCASQ